MTTPGAINRFRPIGSTEFGPDVLRRRSETVVVCVPALNEEPTIGATIRHLADMRADGLIDRLVVIDGGSIDATPEIARSGGADVYQWRDLRPELGPLRGKGDAMWRSLATSDCDIVCFLDADLMSFDDHYVIGLVAPLLASSRIQFVKSAFERPLRLPNLPPGTHQGGRVTEAIGRPLLSLFYPELSVFDQPLSGQIAVRRTLIESLPISTGYAVDVGLLIDSYQSVGLEGMGQVHLGELITVHQDTADLAPMAHEVAMSIVRRAERDGIVADVNITPYVQTFTGETMQDVQIEVIDRPPLADARAARVSPGRN